MKLIILTTLLFTILKILNFKFKCIRNQNLVNAYNFLFKRKVVKVKPDYCLRITLLMHIWKLIFHLYFFFIYFEHSYLVEKIAVVIWCKSLALLDNCMKIILSILFEILSELAVSFNFFFMLCVQNRKGKVFKITLKFWR